MNRSFRKALRPTAFVILVTLLVFTASSPPSRAQFQNGPPATVILLVVDSYGKPLDYKVESFHRIDQPNVNLAGQFKGLTLTNARVGNMYEFRLAPVNYEREHPAFRQFVSVAETSTLAVFSVPKMVLEPDRSTPWPITKLVLRPVPCGKNLWVNVRPAYGPDISRSDTSDNALVDEKGGFSLHGTHGGLYIVTIYEENKIFKLVVVDIPQFAPPEAIEVKVD